jgi:TPR repeat protein
LVSRNKIGQNLHRSARKRLGRRIEGRAIAAAVARKCYWSCAIWTTTLLSLRVSRRGDAAAHLHEFSAGHCRGGVGRASVTSRLPPTVGVKGGAHDRFCPPSLAGAIVSFLTTQVLRLRAPRSKPAKQPGPVFVLAGALTVFAVTIQLALPAFGADETYERPVSDGPVQQLLKRLFEGNPFGKSYALVVGVGDYDDVAAFPSLAAPAQDALRVRDFLRDEAEFDYIVMLTDRDATRKRIDHLMDSDLPNRLHANDRFLFYFSGHGVTRTLDKRNGTRRGYLVLEASHKDEWDEMIDMPRVQEWAENLSNVRHVLFLVDACFSGLAGYQIKASSDRDKTLERLALPSSYLITAGGDQDESFSVGDESLFTRAFLDIARGRINPPPDGIVSLDDMMVRIKRVFDAKRAASERINMHPQLFAARESNNDGEFFFLTPTTHPSPYGTAGIPPTSPEAKGEYNYDGLSSESIGTPPTSPDAARLEDYLKKAERELVRSSRLAADQGDAQAQADLAHYYEYALGGLAKDEQEAARLNRLAADQGNAQGQADLGRFYEHGIGGVVKDEQAAARLYRLAADQGDSAAQADLARFYEYGLGGLAKDEHEAARWYWMSAHQVNSTGLAELGRFYAKGLGGLSKDEREAARLFRLAADHGNARGQTYLADLYERGGGGVTKDENEAARLYRHAADQGDAIAQTELGRFYEYGLGGLEVNLREEARLFQRAAEQGYALGQVNLGRLYEYGVGGLTKDERAAARLYRLAADQGDAAGQANLGRFYEYGLGGLTKDEREAAQLYRRAADQGNEYAKTARARLARAK